MKQRTIRSKIKLYSITVMAVVLVLSAIMTGIYSRSANRTRIVAELERIANQKNLEFQANLNSQIILALQMAKSPVVVDYFLDPKDDDLFEQAKKEIAAYQESFLGRTSFWINAKDLKFYSDLNYSYTLDPSNPDDYWWNMTMKETEVYNFNINYNKELGKTMLWLNVVVRDTKDNAIGIVGTGIPITEFVNDMYKNLPDGINMYLYNNSLEVTGAKDQKILAEKHSITEFLPGLDNDKALTDQMISFTKKGEYVINPIKVIGWNLVLFVPAQFSDNFSGDVFLFGLILDIVCLIIIVIFTVILYNLMNRTTEHLDTTKEKASVQVDLMDQVNATITENVDYLEQFGNLIEHQINQISTSTENTNDLMNDLEAMNILRKDSIDSTNDLADSSRTGNEHISNITAKIGEMSECTNRLTSANNLIASITSKTNLLAMNASIEASHAGEQGKGFAVVAKEIRALAEKSRAQQQDVSRAIADINAMVKDMVSYSETAKASFDQIVANTERVQDNFQNMSNKLESEASLVQTISANLQNVSNSNQKINLSFAEMKQSNKLVSKEISKAVESSDALLVVTDELLKKIRGEDKE
ncbi:methyl-accepting chemotaxis protein [Treponema sp.]|uniref:methyl-accepting chemotaxis protein n=1 Tax=Treponema sp. TaxID=166 RepID=UPI00298E3D0A|nr:methyl-accepting chemotaxis protein [Treponema sp.]